MNGDAHVVEQERFGGAAVAAIEEPLGIELTAYVQAVVALARGRQAAARVDGAIIGTGEADFTKGNQAYTLRLEDKTFQLLDVPGIEGNEGQYADLVRQAVARAHLVIYVNGTNKKPEALTAARIADYLQRGTRVLPVLNAPGYADSYESPENRLSLETEEPLQALRQTEDVLRTSLRPDILVPGMCVQGLLAFSSLALDPETGLSSIVEERSANLGRHQGKLLQYFESALAMREFSRIEAIADVVRARAATFRRDIVESNEQKARDLLSDNLERLHRLLTQHRQLMAKEEPAFAACREALEAVGKSYRRELRDGCKNLVDRCFNDVCDAADAAIKKHFGHQDNISVEVTQSFETSRSTMLKGHATLLEALSKRLAEDVRKAMTRLLMDVQRAAFQARAEGMHDDDFDMAFRFEPLSMDLDLSDWGSAALTVGSYALLGFNIGLLVGGVGAPIGALVGALVGVAMQVLSIFVGRDKRIRKAQAQMREQLDGLRRKAHAQVSDSVADLVRPVDAEIDSLLRNQIEPLLAQLAAPEAIITRQMARMQSVLKKLEAPHGDL